MSGGNIERRLRRLERDAAPPELKLPWGRPSREWTDKQLLAVLGVDVSVSDDTLKKLANEPETIILGAPGAIVLGVEEAASSEEWVRTYQPDVP